MAKPKPKPRYVIVRSEGLTTHESVQEAVDLCKSHQEHEPGISFWVCQIMAGVEAQFSHKITRHY